MTPEHLEARRIAQGPFRASEHSGPTSDQLEAVDRLEQEHHHLSLDWHPGTGNLYVHATGNFGRLEVIYRVEEDGRAVQERIWR